MSVLACDTFLTETMSLLLIDHFIMIDELYIGKIRMTIYLGNEELIEKYEEVGIELNNIFMELVSRYKNKELAEIEWNRIIDIGSRRGSELVDYCNMSRENLIEGFSHVADILSDENR
jgi:hypothetical protein